MERLLLAKFLQRIDSLTMDHKPWFGKMNVHQMVCHCTDFFRMAKGTKKAGEYGKVDPKMIKTMAQSGKTVPAPKGFGQVEGLGTRPYHFETDRCVLKEMVKEFSKLPKEYEFAIHPYFGKLDHKQWTSLAIYHLNHHLEQFEA